MTRILTLACVAFMLMLGPVAAQPASLKKLERIIRACAANILRGVKIPPKKKAITLHNAADYCAGLKREALELAAKGKTGHLDLEKRGMARETRTDRE